MAKFEVLGWGNHRTLCVESDRILDCMDYYSKESFNGIVLSKFHGYSLDNIEFLKDFPLVKGLVIPEANEIDISGVEDLQGLKYISISDNKQAVDYSTFPDLEEIRNVWHPKMKITEECRKLKHLYLRKYNPKSKDFTELCYLKNLEYLEIVQSTMTSTNGVDKYNKLNDFRLHYLAKLETLCEMEDLPLKSLTVGNCKRIRNHEHVKAMKSLEYLKLNECGEMPSIDFIKEMPNLKDFRFMRTDVLDGDMSPCLGLEGTAFTSKKHFSHTYEQMCKLLKSK